MPNLRQNENKSIGCLTVRFYSILCFCLVDFPHLELIDPNHCLVFLSIYTRSCICSILMLKLLHISTFRSFVLREIPRFLSLSTLPLLHCTFFARNESIYVVIAVGIRRVRIIRLLVWNAILESIFEKKKYIYLYIIQNPGWWI